MLGDPRAGAQGMVGEGGGGASQGWEFLQGKLGNTEKLPRACPSIFRSFESWALHAVITKN